MMNQKKPESADLDQLRSQIRGIETAGRMDDGVRVSSGCAAIDRLLPESGYQRGTLVQWLTSGGLAADYLSLLVARQACQDGGALVVLDPLNQFYPPAAAAIGINLDNLIVLRTENQVGAEQELQADLLWSVDQALRCPAVAAVWGPLDRIDERWFRRFQLSAETSGCLGLFIQPIQAARQPSWAEVQWVVTHLPEPATKRTGESCVPDVVARELALSRLKGGTANKGGAANKGGTANKGGAANEGGATNNGGAASSGGTSSGSRYQRGQAHSEQHVRLQLTRCRGTQTGKTVNLSINTITGNVQLARRDYEQQQRTRNRSKTTGLQTGPLSVVSQLADPATGRQRA